jgi:hypothetical protein
MSIFLLYYYIPQMIDAGLNEEINIGSNEEINIGSNEEIKSNAGPADCIVFGIGLLAFAIKFYETVVKLYNGEPVTLL